MSPIRPENKARYPANWEAISKRIRFDRADGRCECTGQCGAEHRYGMGPDRCNAPHAQFIWRDPESSAYFRYDVTGYRRVRIILTVAHLDHQPENCDESNLLAMCQRCHLRYDREHHAEQRRLNKDKAAGQAALFNGGDG